LKALRLVAVTGTKGKTTTTFLIEHLLGFPELPVGLLGSVRYDIGQRSVPSIRATPASADLWRIFAQMRDEGCHQAVVEVTSYGIEQRRILGVPFEGAVFTNLSHDHLDYHGSMEHYFASKARVFIGNEGRVPQFAVINIDDEYGRRLLAMLPAGVRPLTFCVESASDTSEADFRFEVGSMNALRSTGRLITRQGAAYPCVVPLPGCCTRAHGASSLRVADPSLCRLRTQPRSYCKSPTDPAWANSGPITYCVWLRGQSRPPQAPDDALSCFKVRGLCMGHFR
ncbi:MAG: hypothetical protein B7X06_03620, partial [Verrucomicrobia bacterium 21-51-4]